MQAVAGRGLRLDSAHRASVPPELAARRDGAAKAGALGDEAPRKGLPRLLLRSIPRRSRQRAAFGMRRKTARSWGRNARAPGLDGSMLRLCSQRCAARRSSSPRLAKPEMPRAARAAEQTNGESRKPGRGKRGGPRCEVNQTPRLFGNPPLERRAEVATGEATGPLAECKKKNSAESPRNEKRRPRASFVRTTQKAARNTWPAADYEFVPRIPH